MESSSDQISDIPVELRFSEDGSRPSAVVGLRDALAQKEMAYRLREVEEECETTIRQCKSILRQTDHRNPSAVLRWEIAELLMKFLRRQQERGFIVLNRIEAFAQGLGIAKSYVEAMLRFRNRYPDKSRIHSDIPWGKYYELVWFNDPSVMEEYEKTLALGKIWSTKEIQQMRKKANRTSRVATSS